MSYLMQVNLCLGMVMVHFMGPRYTSRLSSPLGFSGSSLTCKIQGVSWENTPMLKLVVYEQ